MTKPRDAMSWERPISVIGAAIGWDAAAAAVSAHRGRPLSASAVRNWTDDGRSALPTVQDALALDLAFIAAGGDHAPILSAMAAHVGIALQAAPSANLVLVAADIADETGDAVSAVLKASQPGATRGQVEIAKTELLEARNTIDDALRVLEVKDSQRSPPPDPAG